MPRSKDTEVELKWNGKQVYAAMVAAAKDGVNEVMSECEKAAKVPSGHPNWQNQTGAAEGSVQIIEFAKPVGFNVVGVWGSKGINYAIYLEGYYGPWLRGTADRLYPRLPGLIRKHFKRRSAGLSKGIK